MSFFCSIIGVFFFKLILNGLVTFCKHLIIASYFLKEADKILPHTYPLVCSGEQLLSSLSYLVCCLLVMTVTFHNCSHHKSQDSCQLPFLCLHRKVRKDRKSTAAAISDFLTMAKVRRTPGARGRKSHLVSSFFLLLAG